MRRQIKTGSLKSILLLAFLAFLGCPQLARAGCSQDIYYSLHPTHIVYGGHCSTEQEAVASCNAIAVAHGYQPTCGPNGNTNKVIAGWFWDLNNVRTQPFHFVDLSYGSANIPKDYKSQGRPKCEDQCAGDPVNLSTGNKFEHRVEFRSGTRFPLEVSWDYNARLVPSYTLPQAMIFGPNRTHFYGRTVTSLTSPQTSVSFVARPNGNASRFELNGDEWVGPAGTAERLVELVQNGARDGWVYEDGSGTKEHYDAFGSLIAIEAREGIQTLTYNGQGRLYRVSDESGRYIQFAYYVTGVVSSIQLPDGSSMLFRYTPAKLLDQVEYPDGSIIKYRYNEPGYAHGQTNSGALTGVVDEQNNRYSSTYYDRYTRATRTDLGDGSAEATLVSYDGTTSTAVLPNGSTRSVVSIVSVGAPVVSAMSAACSNCPPISKSYQFDGQGATDAMTVNGVLHEYDHDMRGRLTRRTAAANFSDSKRTHTYDWDASGATLNASSVLNHSGVELSTSAWSYNERDQVLTSAQSDPETSVSRITTTVYCEQLDIANGICPTIGLVTSLNGPRTDANDSIAYTYYASDDASCASSPNTCPHRKGDLWKVTDALGHITETLAYDGAGRPLSIKDPNGIITDFTYHPRGWLTARKVRGPNNAAETDDQITTIEYWPTGLVKKVTQPDGAFTSYTYDAAHRLTDIADNAGNTIHYTLDNAGNRTAEETKDAGGVLRRNLSRVYNQLGQLQTAKDAYNHATGFTYDANGNNQTVTDALGRVADNDYDPLNRLVRTLQDVGGIEAETKFEYDAQDNLTKVTDPKGLDTTYQYNGFGDLVQLSSPDTGVTTYTYDSAGNRKTQTDARGITATYSYDALNRLTGIAYPTSSLDVAYLYDTVNAACTADESFAIGRLARMTDGSGETQYCYDRFGNLTRKRQITNGQTFELRYAYTLAGQVRAITYPDGAVVDYVCDGQGRTTEIGVTPAGDVRGILLNQVTYYPFGPVAGWTYGNGRTMTRTLNQNYQPVVIEDPNTGGLSLGYEFDVVGNLKKLYNADQSLIKAQYGYDTLNRLTDVMDGPTGTVIDHYAYDATGNRTSFTNSGGTTTFVYPTTSHQLNQVGGILRSYDPVGNTTQIGGNTKELVYNDTGRMSQVKAGGALVMNYQINGKGEQVSKYIAASYTYSVYDEAGQWIGDYDVAGTAIQQAIWLGELPVGLLTSAAADQKLHHLEPDHLGTPRAVIDGLANVAIWRWDLEGEAFGNTVPNQDPDGNGVNFVLNMRYPGQFYDDASGMVSNGFRTYDSTVGRYIESDPLGQMAGTSVYGYVHARPHLFSDRWGLSDSPVVNYIVEPGHRNGGAWSPDMALPSIPGAPASRSPQQATARTNIGWEINSECAENKLGEWALAHASVRIYFTVYKAASGLSGYEDQDEQNHIDDFRSWAEGPGRLAADGECDYIADNVTSPSKADCIREANRLIQNALVPGAVNAVNSSNARWDEGPNPPHTHRARR